MFWAVKLYLSKFVSWTSCKHETDCAYNKDSNYSNPDRTINLGYLNHFTNFLNWNVFVGFTTLYSNIYLETVTFTRRKIVAHVVYLQNIYLMYLIFRLAINSNCKWETRKWVLKHEESTIRNTRMEETAVDIINSRNIFETYAGITG